MSEPVTPLRAMTPRLRLLGAAGVVIILGGWAAASLIAGSFFVPAPWTTIADAALLLSRGPTWTQILITMLRVAVGFAAGFCAGLIAGIAMGARKELDALFKPLVMFFQGMPPLLWAIPLVALMGVGHLPTVTVIALITFPLVAVTIGEGMSTLPREYGEMLTLFAPGFGPRTRELILPHLTPFLGASVKAGLVLAVKASVTAEYFGANDGIGFQIQAAYMSMRIHNLFAWALVLILVIIAFNRLVPRVRLAGPFVKRLFADRTPGRRRRGGDGGDGGDQGDIHLAHGPAPHRAGRGELRLAPPTPAPPRCQHHRQLRGDRRDLGGFLGSERRRSSSSWPPSCVLRADASPARRASVLPSRTTGAPRRSVAENTALPLVYQGYPRKNALSFARYLLGEAGLPGEEEKRPHELSGGMKKRAALARCFARVPDAILLDEPFSGLHEEARVQLWDLFLRLLALHPVPVMIVTHYPEEVSSSAACRYFVLEDGSLVEQNR